MSTLRQPTCETGDRLQEPVPSQTIANNAHLEIVNAHNMYWKQWSENREADRTPVVHKRKKRDQPKVTLTQLGLRVLGFMVLALIVGGIINSLASIK